MRIIDKILSDKFAKTTKQSAVGLVWLRPRLHQKLHWDDLQARRSTKLLSQFLIYKIQKRHCGHYSLSSSLTYYIYKSLFPIVIENF